MLLTLFFCFRFILLFNINLSYKKFILILFNFIELLLLFFTFNLFNVV